MKITKSKVSTRKDKKEVSLPVEERYFCLHKILYAVNAT